MNVNPAPSTLAQSTRAQPAPALDLTDVVLDLGDGEASVRALDSVSLRIEPGEFAAVVGPSGSGKSSLLAVAGLLSAPTSGSVRVHGTEVSGLGPGAAARFRLENIGFVFQSGNLIPALTAADQLRLAARLAGNRRLDPEPLLRAVGMERRAGHRPEQLSGGERQRVGIARALVNRPPLLLVDEPTAALDRRRSAEVVGLLAEQAARFGVAVLMVTHDHDVLGHCDRILEMVDGRLAEAAAVA
ncbi:ABC transporter ATP-binding protein [Sinomonas sp. ASV322]|uniref:ABC transporter ATP-binding protein n=1 Tax=Sinomonas sp. ASV322 TaxID=3041920 RepID=UPI0027DAD719|nr:ABC transporter ATP-binding protein [Sinomonas sp. ASV322]MDQ4503597.1 ABC transporter ATP-binding protein [Sinomonas sp. ASV322]